MEPALGWVVSSLGHLIFEIMMGFIAFGSVVALFACLIGLVVWILRELMR
jgi:cbb3-type cytochrome oxidase subunit 3